MSSYNIWSETKTHNGLIADEVISSLQKSIRRSMIEEACGFAYELYISSAALLNVVWHRLLTISVEDVGFGNLDAAGQVHNLYRMSKEFPYDDVDQPMYFIHAIRILCASTKDRSSDYLKNIIIKGFAQGYVPEILDVALDKHTKRGQELGRGSIHFFEEGALVSPQLEADNDYRERYGKILESFDPAKTVKDAFVLTAGRY